MTSLSFSEISVLIPGYSIEDLPTDLQEDDAASLLNAIACAWHPELLRRSSGIPILRQAESLDGYSGRRIILVPSVSESWMPHEWRTVFRDQHHVVIDKCISREQWLAAIDNALQEAIAETQTTQADTEDGQASDDVASCVLLEHFLALGINILQVSLLSRRRHHYVDPDNLLLNSETRLAADASAAGDEETCRRHLQKCFDHLRETRERFFPMDCYLVDICLPSEQEPADAILPLLDPTVPLNLFATGQELLRWVQEQPELADRVRSAVHSERLCLLTGHDSETRSSLGSFSATLADLKRCDSIVRQITGDFPRHWARRRFGLLASLPTLLSHQGYLTAFHVALDDGLYPDREKSQVEWRAPDGSCLAASSRIPLAIDSASGFLKFADRYNESMQDDNTAALFLARLPSLKSPWLRDLQIASVYAPVLGQFATMTRLEHVTSGNRLAEEHDHADYLSPFLIQSSVLKTEPPITGPATLRLLFARLDSLRVALAMAQLSKATIDVTSFTASLQLIEQRIALLELRHVDVSHSGSEHLKTLSEEAASCESDLERISDQILRSIQHRLPSKSSDDKGLLIVNPIPFSRSATVEWPKGWKPPAVSKSIDLMEATDDDLRMLVKLPPGGFVWLKESNDPKNRHHPLERVASEPPLAEPLILRNRHFEVTLSDRTGGIESILFHGKRGNRLAQQVCFRYEREQSFPDDGSGVIRKTSYAVPRLVDHKVLTSGTVFASVETVTQLLAPTDQTVIAVVRQVTSIDRALPRVHVQLSFEDIRNPLKGNPWLTYFGSRFAWDNEAATVTRAVMGQAAGFRAERFESPDYVEISDDQHRALICSFGRSYHRRSGPRMIDSLMIVEGETARSFQFIIELDQMYPLRTATDVMTPPLIQQVHGQSPTLESSWILGLSARNVDLVRAEPKAPTSDSSAELRLTLLETEGAACQCMIRTASKPSAAFAVSGDDREKYALEVTEQGVIVPMNRWQLREVLLLM